MTLSKQQVELIFSKISMPNEETIVAIDTTDSAIDWTNKEINYNIYRVDENNNVIWQVTEPDPKTGPISFLKGKPPEDPFVYLGQTETGGIMAGRYTGFVYSIDPLTGVAKRTGFQK